MFNLIYRHVKQLRNTQKKTYKFQNTAKIWNKETKKYSTIRSKFEIHKTLKSLLKLSSEVVTSFEIDSLHSVPAPTINSVPYHHV
jgi:uncharacterized protein YlxW (UPF0749 family)